MSKNKNQNKGQGVKYAIKQAPVAVLIKVGLSFTMFFVFGLACVHNIQPWIAFGVDAVGGWATIPRWLEAPIIGDILQALVSVVMAPANIDAAVACLVAMAMWFVCQFLQILPVCLDNPTFHQQFISQNEGRQYSRSHDGSFMDGLKAKYNRSPETWLKRIRLWGVGAYLIEATITMFRYPPYQGGIEGLWSDLTAGVMTPDYLLWGNMAMMFFTMFAVEGLAKIIIHLWQGTRYFGVRYVPVNNR